MRRRRAGHGDARRAPIGALALVLALGSSVVWGCADFAGGSLTKRLPAFAVTVWSQAAGFVALCAAVGVRGDLGLRSFWLGLLAGVGGGTGLAAFYKALSLGTMSIVSPLTACGAVVPFVIALGTGERPAVVAVIGAVLALGGAVLASLEERRSSSPDRARAVLLAVCAAIALGLFVYFLGLGSREGDALSTLFGARVGSLAALVVLAAVVRAPLAPPRASLGFVALVSVLGSLYPVVTVLLAHVLLGERLTRPQQAGIAVALAGVCAIAAA